MIHSFLLIGQSNMAGRGFIDDVEPISNPHLLVLRNGRWRPMYQPVNADRKKAGVNLAESFADLYSKEHDVDVGLIPCADGGTCLDQWCPGSLLYDHAVYMSRLASRTSTIAGVLWHQGEADSNPAFAPFYEPKFLAIMNGLRKELDLYDVPFLLGGLGDFEAQRTDRPISEYYLVINATLQKICAEQPMTGFVSAEGLTCNPDFMHFDARSLRTFGERYYEVFRRYERKDKVFVEKSTPDAAIRTDLELL